MTRLSGEQIDDLTEALLDAYPTHNDLRMLARTQLDESLEAIADGANQRVVVFNLITWAERSGRADELVRGAVKRTPGNPALQAYLRRWPSAAAPAPSPPASPPTGPATIDIFLSYSRRNRAAMRTVEAGLRAAGLSVWSDEGLAAGTVRMAAIEEAVEQASAMVVLLSPAAKASQRVENEVTLAQRKRKPIYPILVDGDEDRAVLLRLISVHWVDGRQELGEAVERVVTQMGQGDGRVAAQPAMKPALSFPKRKIYQSLMLGGIVVAALTLLLSLWKTFEDERAAAQRQAQATATVQAVAQVTATAQAQAVAQATATAQARALASIIRRTSEEILIPAGEFVMGSPASEGADDEQPQHTVHLGDYFIDKYEVTNARYQACVDAGACDAPQESSSVTRKSYFGNPEYADYPVIAVTWFQAEAFCAWEDKRLPTEAEWEKAARGTDGRKYPWGDQAPNAELLNYDRKEGDTAAVGSYPKSASPYSVMDMAGNVREWVNNWYDMDSYRQSPDDNPQATETVKTRMLRGGSWSNNDNNVRSADRSNLSPGFWNVNFGFRCARSPGTLAPDPESPLTTPVQPTATPFSSRERVDELLIPAGEFVMGSPDIEVDEQPQHTVSLDTYYIDKYEVTNARYQACVDAYACTAPQESSSATRKSYFGNPEYADYPVIHVTWFQAEAFCAWADKRLPTEAEWEKAARGTDGRIFPWGSEFDGNRLNYCDVNCKFDWKKDEANNDGYADTAPIGSYPAGVSPYGVMDMAGNVWEWVNDWYSEDYYRQSPSTNPQGPETGNYRVLRGGSWVGSGNFVRSSNRGAYLPALSGNVVGFRCVRSP